LKRLDAVPVRAAGGDVSVDRLDGVAAELKG
jgi:hypothetical protein